MVRSRLILAFLSAALIASSIAAPAPEPNPDPALDDRPEIIEIIAPAASAQETLDSLNLGEPGSEQSERNKRTIGILRQLFPTLTQIIEQKIQMLTTQVFQIVGPAVLSGILGGGNQMKTGGGGGGGGGGSGSISLSDDSNEDSSSSSNSGSRVSIDLPTLAPDSIEEEDDDTKDVETLAIKDSDSSSSFASGKEVSFTPRIGEDFKLENIKDSPSEDDDSIKKEAESSDTASSRDPESTDKTKANTDEDSSTEKLESTASGENEDLTAITNTNPIPKNIETTTSGEIENESDEDTSDSKNILRKRRYVGTSALNVDENQLISGAESQQSEVRVQFADEAKDKSDDDANSDQQTAAQTNSAQIDELSLDDTDINDENRNKRFLNFGFGGASGGGSGGSGGGSGNFLFDIIRRPAESMARAAGTAFRVLTGTDSIDLGITATRTAVRDANSVPQLVAGSGGTEQTDENAAAADGAGAGADGAGVAKGDGYTEGIPGPITRLFIIANRGIANLIQDLILRLAQTSERIVNFKARLITSII